MAAFAASKVARPAFNSLVKGALMPTEFRFDDLDLREEPLRAGCARDAAPTPITAQSLHCTKTADCTHGCCTHTTP